MKKNILVFALLFAGIIASIAQPVPYNVNKRKFPLGEEFQKLLPLKLGKWNRFAFHDFVPGQEMGKVYYQQDNNQIYVTFGKEYSQAGINTTWTKIYDDATDGKENQIKQKNTTSASNKYLLMSGKSGYFYAWTRNLYYFSIETNNKAIADDFMKLFPY
ncbi:MAG: hypothetical protein IPP60_14710 [Sphingobacteriales bacterium]|jgi:hypothetical protein|nr:hypothetical protein [Sphingobacteriales bacterium]MBP8192221.1 hypothetical protein [Chitinophagales bacterium]